MDSRLIPKEIYLIKGHYINGNKIAATAVPSSLIGPGERRSPLIRDTPLSLWQNIAKLRVLAYNKGI